MGNKEQISGRSSNAAMVGLRYLIVCSILFINGFLVRFYIKNVGVSESREFRSLGYNFSNTRYLPIVAGFFILWLVLRLLLRRQGTTDKEKIPLKALLPFTPFLLLALLFLGYRFEIDHTIFRLMASFVLGISVSWLFGLFYKPREQQLSPKICWMILCSVMIAYVAVYSRHNIIRYKMGVMPALDFGYFENMFWNTIHGRFLYNTVHTGCFLKEHFSPLSAIISPVYLTPIATSLRIIMKNILAVAIVVPLFLLAREKIKNNFLCLTLALTVLLMHHYQCGIAVDYHPVHLEPVLIVFLFYFIEKKNFPMFAVFGVLLLLCMEDMFLALAATGFYVAAFKKKPVAGLATIAGSLVAGYAIVEIIMPAFRDSGATELPFINRYHWLGGSPVELVTTIFSRPLYFLQNLFNADRLTVLLYLFLPFLFLPFVSGGILVVIVPTLMIQLLSNVPLQRHMWAHYSLSVIPFIAVTSIYGASRLLNHETKLLPFSKAFLKSGHGKTAVFLACFMLVSGLHISLVSNSTFFTLLREPTRVKSVRYSTFIAQLQKDIPAKSCVFASDTVYSYLAQRKDIYRLNAGEEQLAEIVEAAKSNSYPELYTIIDLHSGHRKGDPLKAMLKLIENSDFAVEDYYSSKIVVLKAGRDPSGTSDFLDGYWRKFEAEEMKRREEFSVEVADEDASNKKALFVSREGDRNVHIVFGPYRKYPPGEYTATFYLKIANPVPGDIALVDVATLRGHEVLTSDRINDSRFSGRDGYVPFRLIFSLDKFRELEFRVMFIGNADLYVDRIEIDSSALYY